MFKIFATRLPVFLLSFVVFVGSYSSSKKSFAEDEDLIALLDVLEQQTSLVTKTKLNSDFVPGSITTLYQQEMQRFGARTLKEALDLTPSIEVQLNHLGHSLVVLRGLGTPFASGMLKFMLNGQPLMSVAGGHAETMLNMPLHQIERVEIIRGAASVLHGDFAFAGVINLVTNHKRSASVAAGNLGYKSLNVADEFSLGRGGFLGLDFSHYQNSKSGTLTRTDILTEADAALSTAGFSKAPKKINDRKLFNSFGLTLGKDNLEFELRIQNYKTGDYYGAIEFVSEENRDYNQEFTDVFFALNGSGELSSKLHFNWSFSGRQHEYATKTFYTSADIDIANFYNTSYDRFAYRNPIDSLNSEDNLNFTYDLISSNIKNHRLLAGLDLNYFRVSADSFSASKHADSIKRSFIFGSKKDQHFNTALYLQDEWKISPNLILTSGLRVEKTWSDYFTDEDISFSKLEKVSYAPKVSLVYRLTDEKTLKAQYSQSLILPPVFHIRGIDEDPYKAKTDHLEFSYGFNNAKYNYRLTAFYSEFEQMPRGTVFHRYFVETDEFDGWKGLGLIKSYGLELEASYKFNSSLAGFSSLTLLETKDSESGTNLAGRAKETFKAGLSYTQQDLWGLSALVRHLGKRAREPYDLRDAVSSYTVLDLGATFKIVDDWKLGVFVKNLADSKVYSPSPVNGTLSEIYGEPRSAFPDDMLMPGRQFWLEVSYSPK